MKSVFTRLFTIGTAKAADAAQAEKVVVFNKCIYATILLFIPNMAYEAYLDLPYTVVIDASFCFILVFAFLFNTSGHYLWARNLAIVSANLVLLSGNYAEGIAAGNYLIYLPLVVLFSLLVRAKEEKRLIIVLVLLTTGCISLCIFACPQYSTIQEIAPAVYRTMFAGNLCLAFILTVLFTWLGAVISIEREQQMRKAKELAEESTRVKSMFLSNMSHELRTPLNSIIGTANLLLDEEWLPAQKEHLDVLKYSSRHILTLVNDILDFNKIDAGKMELQLKPVNLYQLLTQTEAVFAHQFEAKNLAFLAEKDAALDTWIFADETRLTQVLNNLLGNALKFTQKGQVRLSAAITLVKSDSIDVQFTIADTGIGIPQNKQNSIFESFNQADTNTNRQYGGTGLGLTISKKIVAAMGGDLSVRSRVGEGSAFYFSLPFKRGNLQSPYIKPETRTKPEPLTGMRVLIAEDNLINMRVARKFLQAWDITVVEAVNGLEAVDKTRAATFDLLLLDLEMPEMDGYDALRVIRTFNTHTPAIAFSAAMFANIKIHLEEKGFTDFISKPFRPEELYQKIKQYRQPS